jgi:hypothetical protein
MASFSRILLLLITLAFGIGSTTTAFACATVASPAAMSDMSADGCGKHDSGSSHEVSKVATCALACPAGCLMATPSGIAEASIYLDAKFDTVGNSRRLTGKEVGPEPPRPRTASTS